MTATAIVALFTGLGAASTGAHGSLEGLLSMLIAMRWVSQLKYISNLPFITSGIAFWPV